MYRCGDVWLYVAVFVAMGVILTGGVVRVVRRDRHLHAQVASQVVRDPSTGAGASGDVIRRDGDRVNISVPFARPRCKYARRYGGHKRKRDD